VSIHPTHACPGCKPIAETMFWLIWHRSEQSDSFIEVANGLCKQCGCLWYASMTTHRNGEASISVNRRLIEDLSK
jgi:uncharacterized Zn finger protein